MTSPAFFGTPWAAKVSTSDARTTAAKLEKLDGTD
jgi:hypothetical protein